MNKYYVYLLIDPRTNTPFYVGKGSGYRATVHLRESRKGTENPWKHSKIQKIRSEGLEPVIEYVARDLPENEAYDLEASLIQKYGRAKIDEGGILTNMCVDNRPPDFTGKTHSEEARKRIAEAQRGEKGNAWGRKFTEEQRQRRSEKFKAHGIKPPVRSGPMSEEQKAAIGAGNRGKKRTPEQSAYLSSIRKGKTAGPCSDDKREKIRQANIATKAAQRAERLAKLQVRPWEELMELIAVKRGDTRRGWRTELLEILQTTKIDNKRVSQSSIKRWRQDDVPKQVFDFLNSVDWFSRSNI